MSYMDQSMNCTHCGREHSQFSTGVCLICEAAERDSKAKAAWDTKTPVEQALHYLEKWADPQAMTFNKHDAKFVLGVVNSLAALAAPAPVQPAQGDALSQQAAKRTLAEIDADIANGGGLGRMDRMLKERTALLSDPLFQQGRAAGIEEAAQYLDGVAERYLQEHAETDLDTGAIVWEFGSDGRDYHSVLIEEAAAIRGIKEKELT